MSGQSDIEGHYGPVPLQNPGFAGDTGEFPQLSEADVRGTEYVGTRPLHGGHASVAGTLPYRNVEVVRLVVVVGTVLADIVVDARRPQVRTG